MRASSQRGSALIISIIVVLVMAVIGVSMLRFGAREVASSTAAQRQQALVACAEAGRQAFASRFNPLKAPPLKALALDEPVDPATGTRIVGGHYDTAGMQFTQVTMLPENAFGVDPSSIGSATNRIIGTVTGPKPMKVIVHCQMGGDGTPGSGRQIEVEFGLRFGI